MHYKSIIFIIQALSIIFTGSYTTISTVSNETEDTPKLEIELSKDSFAANETLEGIIRIPLSKSISPSSEISIKIQLPMKKTEARKTVAVALENASFEYTAPEAGISTSNPENEKILEFTGGGEESVAVMVQRYADIDSFDMDIAGQSSNTLSEVKIDVGGEGSMDWYYLGAKERWAEEYSVAEGFEAREGLTKQIKNNKTLMCQLINLPYAKDFLVSAKYMQLNTAGNITAAIIEAIVDGSNVFMGEGMQTCDLSELTSFGWGSCGISSDYGISGETLVCVYSTNGTVESGLYDVKAQSGATATAFSCELETEDCTGMGIGNPFIRAQHGIYAKTLTGSVEFTDWDTSVLSVMMEIGWIAGSGRVGGMEDLDFSTECSEIECPVELKFTANNTGRITLSNVKLRYSVAGTGTEVNELYDVSSAEPHIESIEKGAVLIALPANETIEIPLAVFGIKAPEPVLSTANEAFVEVTFQGETANDTFTVGGAISSPSSAQGMIDETKAALNALSSSTGDTQLILKILGLDADIEAAKTELTSLETRASSDTQAIRDEIKALRDRLPREIIFGSSIRDFQIIEPADITADIAPAEQKEEVYLMQDKAQVKASSISFSIKDFAGTTAKYALIRKEITARSALSKIDIYEVISKSVADSRSDISFETPPTPVKDDPIVKWFESSISTGAKVEKNYVIKTDFDVAIDKVKTIIVPTADVPEEEEDEAVCGDGICTLILEDEETCPDDCASKTSWGLIITIIIIAGILFAYLAFYRGKYSLWHLTKRKKPFTSRKDLDSVKDFIRNSREKKAEDSVIKSRLLEKGWKDEQIKFAFGEMEWEKKEKAAEKPTSDLKPMQDYIKTAIARKIPKEKVLNNLVSNGWKEEDVKEELGMK